LTRSTQDLQIALCGLATDEETLEDGFIHTITEIHGNCSNRSSIKHTRAEHDLKIVSARRTGLFCFFFRSFYDRVLCWGLLVQPRLFIAIKDVEHTEECLRVVIASASRRRLGRGRQLFEHRLLEPETTPTFVHLN